MLGYAHVAAAVGALLLATVVLWQRKGTKRHVVLGRAYVAVLIAANTVALLLREQSGGLGPFHGLAVVSLITVAAGLATSPRRRRGAVPAHARLMLWSVLGLATAGLAQLAGAAFPRQEPWPVLLVTAASIGVGFVAVPATANRAARRAGTRPGRMGAPLPGADPG